MATCIRMTHTNREVLNVCISFWIHMSSMWQCLIFRPCGSRKKVSELQSPLCKKPSKHGDGPNWDLGTRQFDHFLNIPSPKWVCCAQRFGMNQHVMWRTFFHQSSWQIWRGWWRFVSQRTSSDGTSSSTSEPSEGSAATSSSLITIVSSRWQGGMQRTSNANRQFYVEKKCGKNS